MPSRLLVVSAHSADFVWRAAGAIATVSTAGGTATSSRCRTANAASRASSGRARPDGGAGQGIRRAKPRRPPRRSAPASRLRPRRLPARAGRGRGRAADRSDPRARATGDPHARRQGPFNPDTRSPTRRRSRRASSRAARGRERVQDDRAARAAAVRAPSARALRVRPDDVPRHHRRCGTRRWRRWRPWAPRRTCGSTTPSGPGTGRTTRAGSRGARTSGTPRRSSARFPSSSTRCDRLRRARRLGVATVHEAAGRVGIVDLAARPGRPGVARRRPGADRASARRATTRWCTRLVAHAEPGRRARADERRAGAGGAGR